MTKQTINIGSAPDDGTGDPLRTAFDKVNDNFDELYADKAPLASPTFTGTVAGITKSMVGLGSVDNTADTAKPVSTAQQTALDLKLNRAGTTTNDNAAAGGIGEHVESIIVQGSSVPLTTDTSTNITSISLTAGDWDVNGSIDFDPAATTSITRLQSSISLVSGTVDVTPGRRNVQTYDAFVPANQMSLPVPGAVRLSLAETTLVYLVARPRFTVSTLNGYGIIEARRIR